LSRAQRTGRLEILPLFRTAALLPEVLLPPLALSLPALRCATVALVLGLSAACAPVRTGAAPSADLGLPPGARAEILWDRYGIPHITARDMEALGHAFGWAQARNHADLLLSLYGQSRARGAEYWGAHNLDADRWLQTVRLPAYARQALDDQTPEVRQYIEAFADGINAYARAHPDAIIDSVRVVLPVTAADVMAQSIGISLLFSTAEPAARRWSQSRGSNAWAIGPRRSASGHALLLANPHLPWEGAFTWFEAQLTAPGLDASGATLLGLPILAIAFNEHLGWTHTVNTQDTEDLYELTLAEGGYRWDDGVRAFEVDTVRIRVRDAGGALRDEALVRRRSVHGPVIAQSGDRALALRQVIAGDAPAPRQLRAGLIPGYLEAMRARSLQEFEGIMGRHPPTGFNIIYADRAGNILFHYGGVTPRRPGRDHAFWSGVVRGDTSGLLWDALHGYDEMPRLLNPPSGWVQNANDPPWFAAYPRLLDPDAFPAYFAPVSLASRPRQSIRLLLDDAPISLEEMIRRKHSTEMELAGRLVPDLVRAARAGGSDEARAAADVLDRWDRSTDAESRGAVLFEAWVGAYSQAAGGRAFETPWSADDPLGTPRGLADPRAAVAALGAAAAAVRGRTGALDVAWGDVHRLRMDDVDLPANGGSGGLGIFRTMHFADAPDGRRVPVHGDSYVAAIEFSTPVRARALLGYGNASQPGSPHRTDQLDHFVRQELRPVWRTRPEIEANLSAREVF
jgi:acyl-homoserine-lactone acylase